MDKPGFSGMFDRTPILLGPGGYFLNITDQTVKIPTIDTIHFFQPIQITEVVPVDDNIIFAVHFRDSIDGEADQLKKGKHHVHENSRDQTGPDHRCCQNICNLRIPQILADTFNQQAVLRFRLPFKPDPLSLDCVKTLLLLFEAHESADAPACAYFPEFPSSCRS